MSNPHANPKICHFRGTNKGRRRQKRRCRKTCSQSGARIGATDILSCLKIYNCDTELLLFQKFHGLRLGNGGARKRTSQEEGDLQVRRNIHHILKEQCLPIVTREVFLKNIFWKLYSFTDTRHHGRCSVWTGRWGRTSGSGWRLAPL